MSVNEQSRRTSVADPETLPLLLDKAREFARDYIDTAEQRPVFPAPASLEALKDLDIPFPQDSTDPIAVLEQLHAIGSNAAVNLKTVIRTQLRKSSRVCAQLFDEILNAASA